MNHESCRERLVELVYGELAGREAREAERHLEGCEPCRAERDRLLATRAAMRRLEAPAVPERVDPIVLAAARRAAEARGGGGFGAALRGFGAKLAAGTAVAVLLALVVLNVGRFGEKGPLEMGRRTSVPEAEPRAEAPPATGVGPLSAPAAEPRIEPSPEPTARKEATARREATRQRAVPPAPARAEKKAEKAASAERRGAPSAGDGGLEEDVAPAPAAPPRAGAPARVAGARPEAAADEFTAGEAARRARDERPRREQEERQREEYAQRRSVQNEWPAGEGVGSGAPAFAVRPPAAAPPPEAPRQPEAAPAPAPLAAAPSPALGRSAPSPRAPDEADRPEAKHMERYRAAKAASTPTARGVGPTTQVARDIERRRAAGELSEAVRRFEPCPGGDRRRAAWIDRAQRILKLVRERGDGSWVEEWFDGSGRLREALVHGRAGGAPWTRRVVIGEGGARTSEDEGTSGLAPATPPPALVERDPSDAFFAGPGCGR